MALFPVTLTDPNYPRHPISVTSQHCMKRLNRLSSFWHRDFPRLIVHCDGREFGYLQKRLLPSRTSTKTLDLKHLATAHWPSQVLSSVTSLSHWLSTSVYNMVGMRHLV